jgi:IS605 OrfB family transposase
MKRTIALKLNLSQEQSAALLETQKSFANACNQAIPFVFENRCWNRVALHHLCYYQIRESIPSLGSQMVCNAFQKVCSSYKVLKIKKSQEVPIVTFKDTGSVHYDKRTYSLKDNILSLYTVNGRIKCEYSTGDFQKEYLERGMIKEAELIRKGKRWFFNLSLDLPDAEFKKEGKIFSVDVGENNLATTSNGTIYGGGKLRHERDMFLARRAQIQSNGSRSAKRCLQRVSGKERRHVKETNHIVSKQIVQEAVESVAKVIVLEDLTNIRKRIKGNKRMRSRLHRWSWYELQQFVEYKAQAKGIKVVYVNPAYTSQTCSKCDCLGSRHKHLFKCSKCGSYQHSDCNAAINLLKLGESVVSSMAPVNVQMVAVA